MTPAEIVAALRPELERDARIDAAYLFGSAARGALRDGSDVDVAIRWVDDAARTAARADMLAILGRLGRAVGRDVHLVDLAAAGPELRRRAYEGEPIVDRDPRRTRDARVRTAMEIIDWEYARRLRRAALDTRLGGRDG